MLRAASLVAILRAAACHRDSSGPATAAPSHRRAAPDAATTADLATQLAWLPRDTVSVTRLRPGSIFVLEWLASQIGGPKPDCWRRIEKTIGAGYMFEVTPGRSLLGFHGASKRGDIERCIETALPAGHVLHATLERDGDMTVLDTEVGRAGLWWQGDGWVVAASVPEIRQARAAREIGLEPCVRRVLEKLPDQPIAYGSCNATFENLLGVPTRGWLIGASLRDRKMLEATVTVFYASPPDAERAQAALTPDRLPAVLPQPLRKWLGGLPRSVEGNRLAIRVEVTPEQFASLDIDALKKMAEQMKSEEPLERYWRQQKRAAEEREKSKAP